MEAEPSPGEGHAVESMSVLEGVLYESVRVRAGDPVAKEESRYPVLHTIEPEASPPIASEAEEPPLYGSFSELSDGLEFLHLSSAEGALWGAAGKSPKAVEPGEEAGQVTVVRRVQGVWSQPIGPGSPTSGITAHPLGHVLGSEAEEQRLLGGEAKDAAVSGIAAEPGSEDAWLALRPPTGSRRRGERGARAHLSRWEGARRADAALQGRSRSRHRPEGCHRADLLSGGRRLLDGNDRGVAVPPRARRRTDHAGQRNRGFHNVIAYRPPDQGLPQVVADAPPPDTSGLNEEGFVVPKSVKGEESKTSSESKVQLPLLSRLHSKLLHRTTLQLSFHLAVKARVRLLAKRDGRVVASTPTLILKAGSRTLRLSLNPRSWPTKLSLQTHALAPLPLVSSVTGEGANVTTVSTGLVVLPHGELTSGPLASPAGGCSALVASPHHA